MITMNLITQIFITSLASWIGWKYVGPRVRVWLKEKKEKRENEDN